MHTTHILYGGFIVHHRWLDLDFWDGIDRHVAELDRYEALAKARKAEQAASEAVDAA